MTVLFGAVVCIGVGVLLRIILQKTFPIARTPRHMYTIYCETCSKGNTLDEVYADTMNEAAFKVNWDKVEGHRGHKVRMFDETGVQDENAFEVQETKRNLQ